MSLFTYLTCALGLLAEVELYYYYYYYDMFNNSLVLNVSSLTILSSAEAIFFVKELVSWMFFPISGVSALVSGGRLIGFS